MAQRRRSATALPRLLAGGAVCLALLEGLSFVGQAPARRELNTEVYAEAAAKPGKQKQRLSLKEALERAKAQQEVQQADKKEEAKLAPEMVFWQGPPSSTEVFVPFLACFLVLGIIPFITAVNRQFRVKYKITDRRVSVTGGFDGKDVTEFSYQEIKEMQYGMRWFGYCADVRIDLRDGAKVEMFGLLNFEENYNYILSRVEPDARKRSPKPPKL